MSKNQEVMLTSNFFLPYTKIDAPFLTEQRTISIFAPSGYDKSQYFRYLAFNKRYKAQFKDFKNVKIIYIDSTEIKINSNVEQSNYLMPQISKTDEIEILFLKDIADSMNVSLDRDVFYLTGYALRDELMKLMEYMLDRYSEKVFYFVLDGSDEFFFSKDYNSYISFFKYFKNKFRGRVEYIFVFGYLSTLKKILTSGDKSNSYLFSSKIIYLPLLHPKDTYRHMVYSPLTFIMYLLRKRNPAFQMWLNKIYKISGGYPLYTRILMSLKISRDVINNDLLSATRRLLGSFTDKHIHTLISIAKGEQVEKTDELTVLVKLGIVRLENNQLQIFSIILKNYLLGNRNLLTGVNMPSLARIPFQTKLV